MQDRLRDRWGMERSEGAKAYRKDAINRGHGGEGEGLEVQARFQSEDGGSGVQGEKR